MRLLVAAGGTGGGVYPALAVVDALAERDSVNWVGGEAGIEAELVGRAGLQFHSIPAAGIHGVGLARLPGNLLSLGRGYLRARDLIREIDPDAVLYTGGYVGVPVELAARKAGGVAFVPDIEPALAMRWISRRVDSICVTAKRSVQYYPAAKRVRVTGYPSRFAGRVPTRDEGRRGLGLASEGPVLLVMGGSRGARPINDALWAVLPELLPRVQIVHLTGELDWPRVAEVQGRLGKQADRYRPFGYLHDRMGAALAAADLVISRAGASVLGDYPHFSLPSVLVPYTHAWRYQLTNAEYMAQRGAAVILPEEELPDRMAPVVHGLIEDAEKLVGMMAASRSLAWPDAAGVIVEELRAAAGEGRPG